MADAKTPAAPSSAATPSSLPAVSSSESSGAADRENAAAALAAIKLRLEAKISVMKQERDKAHGEGEGEADDDGTGGVDPADDTKDFFGDDEKKKAFALIKKQPKFKFGRGENYEDDQDLFKGALFHGNFQSVLPLSCQRVVCFVTLLV